MRTNLEKYAFSLNAAATATYTSDSIVIEHCYGYSIHAKWTKVSGTLAGSCKTQKSNDGIYWIDVTTQAITDASGNKEYEVSDAMYKYVRFVATLTGGVADFAVNAHIKGV